MAEDVLVDSEIERGRRLVVTLDERGWRIPSAFWIYQAEEERWRFVIVTPEAAKGAYPLLVEIGESDPTFDLSRLSVVPPSSPLATALGDELHVDGVSVVRLRSNIFQGRYVPEAVVYRLAA